MKTNLENKIKKFLSGLCLITALGVSACGNETTTEPTNDGGSSISDSGSNKDIGEGYDAGTHQDSGSQNNQPPVPIFKYNFNVGDSWIEAHDGEVITKSLKDYRGYYSINPCDSYDSDGKIVEMWIDYIGGPEENSFDMLYEGCHTGGGSCYSLSEPCTEKATLRLKDDKGAESRLSVTFKIE